MGAAGLVQTAMATGQTAMANLPDPGLRGVRSGQYVSSDEDLPSCPEQERSRDAQNGLSEHERRRLAQAEADELPRQITDVDSTATGWPLEDDGASSGDDGPT